MANLLARHASELAWFPIEHIVAIHQLLKNDGCDLPTHRLCAAVGVDKRDMVGVKAAERSNSQLLLQHLLKAFFIGHIGISSDEAEFLNILAT